MISKTELEDRIAELVVRVEELERWRSERTKKRATGISMILSHLATRPGESVKSTEIRDAVMNTFGGSPRSIAPHLVRLHRQGFVKRTGLGEYRITPRGLREQQKQREEQVA